MRKLKRIFESTLARAISATLIVSFILSVFLFFDFYERKVHEVMGYYLVYKGDKELKKENLQKAIYYYEKGIKYHPGHYRAMYNLANIYVVYEDYYSALNNYKKALKVKPDYEIARIDYAIILTQIYEIDEAIEEYKKVIDNIPKFYKIPFIVDKEKSYYYNKGVAYYNMGLAYRTKSLLAGLDFETRNHYMKKASDCYKKSIEFLNNYNANYNNAIINHLLKNKNLAGFYYCKAIELDPMGYEAHLNHAILLNSMNEFEASYEEFNKAGLLIDSAANPIRAKQLYNMLNETNTRLVIDKDKEYFQKLAQKEEESLSLKYKSGKVIFDDPQDTKNDTFIKDFSTCAKRELFMGDGK